MSDNNCPLEGDCPALIYRLANESGQHGAALVRLQHHLEGIRTDTREIRDTVRGLVPRVEALEAEQARLKTSDAAQSKTMTRWSGVWLAIIAILGVFGVVLSMLAFFRR